MIFLKFLRVHEGESLAVASRRARITTGTFCLIERRRFVPTDAMLRRLADAFGVNPPSVLLEEVTPKAVRSVVAQDDVGAGQTA